MVGAKGQKLIKIDRANGAVSIAGGTIGVTLLFVVIALVTLEYRTVTADHILWSADHETGDMSQWWQPGIPNHCGGEFNSGNGTSNATSTVAHSGNYAAELTISTNNGEAHGVRLFRWCEAQQYNELYYSAWYYFPQRNDTPAGWWNVFQWKSEGDPIWDLNVGNRCNGDMFFYLNHWIEGHNYLAQLIPKNIPVGQWLHIEAYLKKSDSNTGRIAFWQDGVKIFDIDSVQTAKSSDLGWSVNNYSSGISPSPTTIYVDDAVISTMPTGDIENEPSGYPIYLPMIINAPVLDNCINSAQYDLVKADR